MIGAVEREEKVSLRRIIFFLLNFARNLTTTIVNFVCVYYVLYTGSRNKVNTTPLHEYKQQQQQHKRQPLQQ